MSVGNHWDVESGTTKHRPREDPAVTLDRVVDRKAGKVAYFEPDAGDGAWIEFDASAEIELGWSK